MKRAFVFRIYPNKAQQSVLNNIFEFCRFLYNSALEQRISYYSKTKKSISYVAQAAQLPEIKSLFPESDIIYSQTLQATLKQVDSAYSGFFRRLRNHDKHAGFPRFKNRDRFRSILFPQANLVTGGVRLLPNKKLKVYGIPGEIYTKWHREISGICKNIRIKRTNTDKYFVVITCDNVELSAISEKTGKECGIDLGINSFATLDSGEQFSHPRNLRDNEEKLGNLQRKYSKKGPWSNRKRRIKLKLAKLHEKIANIRDDFQHKLANKLIAEYDRVYVEKLDIDEMLEKKNYKVNKRNISDAAWGMFTQKLQYKAESAGKEVILVNPHNTSKTCSCCGNIKEILELSERAYNCEICGLNINRDVNAAINICGLGRAARIDFAEAPGFSRG